MNIFREAYLWWKEKLFGNPEAYTDPALKNMDAEIAQALLVPEKETLPVNAQIRREEYKTAFAYVGSDDAADNAKPVLVTRDTTVMQGGNFFFIKPNRSV